jgi:hypothetical protein
LKKLRAGLSALSLSAMVFVFSPDASADAKFELGLRTGYGLPFGKVYDEEGTASGEDLSEGVAGQIPLWVDAGARIGGKLFVGGYVVYGIGILSDEFSNDCDDADQAADAFGGSVSCSISDVRLGAQVQYHFGEAGASIDPWVGGGLGYEWLSLGQRIELSGEDADLAVTLHGFEFLNVQLGLDFPVSPNVALGPFAAFTFASYGTGRVSCSGSLCGDEDSESESIDDTAIHEWLFLGVRAAFVF